MPGIGPRTADAIKAAVASADATRKNGEPKQVRVNTATGEIIEED